MFDVTYLNGMVTNGLWWVLPLLVLLLLVRTSAFSGLVGRWILHLAAKLGLDQNEYHLVRNVKLPDVAGTARLDHVIVSPYGVFMCETNSMGGRISGGRDQASWIRQIGKHESTFHNPLLQHHRHARMLQVVLGLDAGKVLPLLVFVGNGSFKTEMPEHVIRTGGYIRYIKSKTIPILTRADVARLSERLASGQLEPAGNPGGQPATRGGNAAKAKAPAKTCPSCSSAMILRVASKGAQAGQKFWVCSAYPKCKAVVPANARPRRMAPEFGPPKLT